MILPPKQVESGSNEITALPELIKDLAVKGVVFAFDSLNTQKADATPRRRTDGAYKVRTQVPHIAPPQGNAHPEKTIETIVATGNPYIAAVKAKQPTLDDGISQMFTPTETVTQVNKGHGRREKRTVSIMALPPDPFPQWKNAATVIKVERERKRNLLLHF